MLPRLLFVLITAALAGFLPAPASAAAPSPNDVHSPRHTYVIVHGA